MRPSIQLISPKCFSRIIENFKNTSSSCAVLLDIYLSAPITEEIVSSIRDMIDFLKLPFDKTLFDLSKFMFTFFVAYLFKYDALYIDNLPLALRGSSIPAILCDP